MSIMSWTLLGFVSMTGAEVAREFEAPLWLRGGLAWIAFGALAIAFGYSTGVLP